MQKRFDNFEQPRLKALLGMQASVDQSVWSKNIEFLENLKLKIRNHPVSSHPAIKTLNDGVVGKKQLKRIHLEYRHAIVQVFTDALLMAQFQTQQLEPRLAPGSKMHPRCLLNLNVLDEFGFRPGLDREGYYLGNPDYAHYPMFEDILDEFDISIEDRNNYNHSQIADQVRNFLVKSYGCYLGVAALLAVAEEEVILFSPPLRQATKALGLDVDCGYYYVHGVSDDETAEAADDDHVDDLWFILAQACTEADFEYVEKISMEYCDLWAAFWDEQLKFVNLIDTEVA